MNPRRLCLFGKFNPALGKPERAPRKGAAHRNVIYPVPFFLELILPFFEELLIRFHGLPRTPSGFQNMDFRAENSVEQHVRAKRRGIRLHNRAKPQHGFQSKFSSGSRGLHRVIGFCRAIGKNGVAPFPDRVRE